MLRGYRLVIAATCGLAILGALGVGAFVGSLYASNNRHYEPVATNGGQAYPADSPRNGLSDVSGIDAFTQRLIAKPKPRNSDEREQRDLAAQESMAVFAYWMFGAVVLQTVLAGGALYMLVKDLAQNRKSAEAQLRAYLSLNNFTLHVDPFENGDCAIRIESVIHNGGQTPAYDCCHMGNVAAFSEVGATRFFTEDQTSNRIGTPISYVVHNGADMGVDFTSHTNMTAETVREINKGQKRLYAFGMVEYRDTFRNVRRTRFCIILDGPLRDGSDTTVTRITWETAPFHNDAT